MKTSSLSVAAVAAVLVASGCAGSRQVQTANMLWPSEPSAPEIRFEGAIYGSADVGRSFWQKFEGFLFGRSPEEGLGKPYGLCVDGDIWYVADSGRDRVMVFNWKSRRVWTFQDMDSRHRLLEPVNVQIGPDGMLYVADTELGRVVRFHADGTFDRIIGSHDDLESPVGMAWDARGRMLVVDSRRHQVVVFSPDGTHVTSFGERGEQPGQFYYPLGIAVADDGTIYVVDAFHFTVQLFDSDFTYIGDFGHDENAAALMPRPRAVDIDRHGRVYVTDAMRHTVLVFDSAGTLLYRFGNLGSGDGEFKLPAGVHITEDGMVLVVDSMNRRILRFQLVRG